MVRSPLDGATLAEQILVVLVMLVKMVMVMVRLALDGTTLADQSSYSVSHMRTQLVVILVIWIVLNGQIGAGWRCQNGATLTLTIVLTPVL